VLTFNRNDKFEEPELTPEIVDQVNDLLERLRTFLVPRIVLADPITGSRIPNLVRSYIQAHLRRCLLFVDAGVAELNSGRSLVTEFCSRALYEGIATICHFVDEIKPLCDAGDYAAVEQYVSKAAFATRLPSILERHAENKSPNILSLIDKMTKRAADFRKSYDHLSDIVHPNGMGAIVYFATITSGVISFSDEGNNPARARTSLFTISLLLALVELAIVDLEQALRKLK
jgi:hypothetical protein